MPTAFNSVACTFVACFSNKYSNTQRVAVEILHFDVELGRRRNAELHGASGGTGHRLWRAGLRMRPSVSHPQAAASAAAAAAASGASVVGRAVAKTARLRRSVCRRRHRHSVRTYESQLLLCLRPGWRGTVVERRSLTGKLSLSCARPAADG